MPANKYPTRKDYMTGKVNHKTYYETLASEAGISYANSEALPRIRQALKDGDEHLNSIPLGLWDSLAVKNRRITAPVLKAHGDFWSLAGSVCIQKAAAKKAANKPFQQD